MKTVFLVLLLVVSLFLLPSSAYTTMLADCLENVYKLDKEIAKTIINRLSPIINTPLIREFIDLSRNVSLETKTSPRALIEDDACLKTPDFHRIIFENDSIRILDISSNPGKKIPLHTHQWNDIIIVIQGSLFEAEDNLTQKQG